MQFLIDYAPAWALPYIYLLTEREWTMVFNTIFWLVMLTILLASAYCMLIGLGWRRYGGRWYSPKSFQALVQELYTGVREGRVPDYQTMKILDRHVYGPQGSRLRNMTRTDQR